MTTEETVDIKGLMNEVESFTSKIKLQIKQGDQQLISGVTKFIKMYKQLSAYWSIARLASAFHQFGWMFWRSNFLDEFQRKHLLQEKDYCTGNFSREEAGWKLAWQS